VLALGGGTALAAPALVGSVSHGDSVSAAAAACSHTAGDARGDCVNAAAQKSNASGDHGQSGATDNGSKPSGTPDNAHGMAVSAAAKSCAHGTASNRDAHGDCVSGVARNTSTPAGGH
jgi:hypothetical protein